MRAVGHPVSQAVLLVGGLGTRLRPLTYLRPKALMPVANRPLIGYEIELLARHGVTDIVLAVGYSADSLRAELGDGSAWGVSLTFREDPEPLGTAGAIRNVADLLDDAFFCMNGDLIFDLDLTALARMHADTKATVTNSLRQVPDVSHFGLIECDDTGRIRAFREKVAVDETGRNTVNFGVYVMSRDVVERIPPGLPFSNEYDLFPSLLREGCLLYGYLPDRPGYWTDVGRFETYLQANRDVLAGVLPHVTGRVSDEAQIADSAMVITPVDIAPGAVIGDEAWVGPYVSLGCDAEVEAGAVVSDSIICDGASVGCRSAVDASVVAWNATVDERARVTGTAVMPRGWAPPA